MYDPGYKAAEAVTPSNSANISSNGTPVDAFTVGAAGDVKVTMENGQTVTFKGLVSGVIYPIRAKKIFATGTTATDIVALYAG